MPYKDPEDRKAQVLRWKRKNKLKVAASSRQRYLRCKEKIAEVQAAYRKNNPEKIKLANREYREKNKEKISVSFKKRVEAYKADMNPLWLARRERYRQSLLVENKSPEQLKEGRKRKAKWNLDNPEVGVVSELKCRNGITDPPPELVEAIVTHRRIKRLIKEKQNA